MNVLLSSTTWYPFLFNDTDLANLARTVCFWLTIATATVFAVLFLTAKDKRKLAKPAIVTCICFAGLISTLFLYLSYVQDGILPILFFPLFASIICVIVSGVIICFNRKKTVVITLAIICGASLLAVLVCMGVYFASGNAENNNYVTITASENVWLYAITLLFICAGLVIGYIFDKTGNFQFDAKCISVAGICVAMSFALSFVRIVKLPQGGSITVCSLLPLIIFAHVYGVKKGMFVGLIYGLLQAIQDIWIVHPMQFLLDYPIAFACIGISGIFYDKKGFQNRERLSFAFGAVLASIARFGCHLLSGVFAFSEYADGVNPFIYSSIYNSYVFADIAFVIICGLFVFSSKSFKTQILNQRPHAQ